jgi:hypothetical protein
MRWFYAFFLLLVAWGGFMHVVLEDDPPTRQKWGELH